MKQKNVLLPGLAVSALLTGLVVCHPDLWVLEWFSMVPLGIGLLTLASDTTTRLRRLYAYGFFYFLCFGVVVFHWFGELYPLSFIDGMTKGGALLITLLGWLGMSALQAAMGGLVFLLAGFLFRGRFCRRLPLLMPFFAGGLWAVYEWTQTLGFWGVPWGRLAIGQTGFLIGVQTASLLGSYFITFLLVSFNFLLAYALLHKSNRSVLRLSALLASGILLIQYGVGAMLYGMNRPDTGETVRVAAVQGNVDSGEKWDEASREKTVRIYSQSTRRAAEQGAQVVIWPESAFPYTLQEGHGAYAVASSLAEETGVTILAGGFVFGEDGEGEYNAMVCFLPDGSALDTVYAKRHLVPFGEYVPMEPLFAILIPPLTQMEMSGMYLLPGKRAEVFSLSEGAFGSLICFDSIYEDSVRDSVLGGAEVLCVSTNDSWFGDSSALKMHHAQSQLRAVENNRYVVRSANTGLTSVISSRGEVLCEIEPNEDGLLLGEVVPQTSVTLYTKIGNLFVYLWILVILLSVASEVIRSQKEKRKDGSACR